MPKNPQNHGEIASKCRKILKIVSKLRQNAEKPPKKPQKCVEIASKYRKNTEKLNLWHNVPKVTKILETVKYRQDRKRTEKYYKKFFFPKVTETP